MMNKITIPMLVYFISHFFYGQYFTVLGSLLPYFSEETGKD